MKDLTMRRRLHDLLSRLGRITLVALGRADVPAGARPAFAAH
jgi:hypothetical protein